ELVRQRRALQRIDGADVQIAGVEVDRAAARSAQMQRDLPLQHAPVEIGAQPQIDAARLRLVRIGVAVRVEAHARTLSMRLTGPTLLRGRVAGARAGALLLLRLLLALLAAGGAARRACVRSACRGARAG